VREHDVLAPGAHDPRRVRERIARAEHQLVGDPLVDLRPPRFEEDRAARDADEDETPARRALLTSTYRHRGTLRNRPSLPSRISAIQMETLPDRLRSGLDVVSIGINPSRYSVEKGFYFARPQNRFWRALARSGLAPGAATDVVKRPTRAASELTRADWERGARDLRRKLERVRPQIAWFHGRAAWTRYIRHAEGERAAFHWGRQPRAIGGAIVFVTPNPSGLNTRYSLEDLVRRYRELAKIVRASTASDAVIDRPRNPRPGGR
jgi:TDG/mug DNA glycosylase family protein